jgi:hypothetical protein
MSAHGFNGLRSNARLSRRSLAGLLPANAAGNGGASSDSSPTRDRVHHPAPGTRCSKRFIFISMEDETGIAKVMSAFAKKIDNCPMLFPLL